MPHLVTLSEIPGSDELSLQLPDDVIEALSLKKGGTLRWTIREDGTVVVSNADRQLVLVETISTFRHRYLVEVPCGKEEWALDTVTAEDAKEISQKWLGETIVSHRVVTHEEARQIYAADDETPKWLSVEDMITKIAAEDAQPDSQP